MDPQQNVPYLILVCLARSSAEFTGDDILDAVKKAERGENVTLKTSNGWFLKKLNFVVIMIIILQLQPLKFALQDEMIVVMVIHHY